jgi:hypothetical protein
MGAVHCAVRNTTPVQARNPSAAHRHAIGTSGQIPHSLGGLATAARLRRAVFWPR